uniref:Uncharacterized protein n=1 Tax=Tanacetum cinerariifolium TaxID=118510 RepID=A0A6L2LIN8_TANCI|nr:hypothetical protein [Tanacetum cinerariifolium]
MSDDDATGAESPPRGVDSYYKPRNFEDPSPIVYPVMANGAPMEEEWEFFEKMSNGSKTQASVDRNNNHTSSANFVSNQHGTNSEISELSKKVDLLLRNLGKGVPNVSHVSHNACSICGDPSHSVSNCQSWGAPSNEEVNGVYGNRPRNDPFSKSYNPRWRNHPNFRQKDDDNYNRPNNTQQQNHGYKLSELAKSNQGANIKFESLSKSVVNLERQMGKLAEEVHKREAGKLPSYPTLNPKHKPGGPEHVNMVTSLQNGKTYNNDIKIPSVHDFSHDVEDFVTDDKIIVEGKKADNVKSDSDLVNDLLKEFLKPQTQNPKATESPKVREGGVSSTTTPYPQLWKNQYLQDWLKRVLIMWICGRHSSK